MSTRQFKTLLNNQLYSLFDYGQVEQFPQLDLSISGLCKISSTYYIKQRNSTEWKPISQYFFLYNIQYGIDDGNNNYYWDNYENEEYYESSSSNSSISNIESSSSNSSISSIESSSSNSSISSIESSSSNSSYFQNKNILVVPLNSNYIYHYSFFRYKRNNISSNSSFSNSSYLENNNSILDSFQYQSISLPYILKNNTLMVDFTGFQQKDYLFFITCQ